MKTTIPKLRRMIRKVITESINESSSEVEGSIEDIIDKCVKDCQADPDASVERVCDMWLQDYGKMDQREKVIEAVYSRL